MMDKNLILGTILMAVSLGFIIYLILWSRKIIAFIQKSRCCTPRHIIKELNEKR